MDNHSQHLEACCLQAPVKGSVSPPNHQAEAEPVYDAARLYSCARCLAQTIICRCCDRGNVYCSECALPAHLEARRRASDRYQKTRQGQLTHAARQRRYRERQTEKVTHNGSPVLDNPVGHSSKRITSDRPPISWIRPTAKTIVCYFCREICSQFLRLDYLLHPS